MWSRFQSIASKSLTSYFSIALQNAVALKPEVIKPSMLALIISSTKSIPHFKFYYCSSLLSLKTITLIIIIHCSQQSPLYAEKKSYFIDSDCSRIFEEARGQPLNQLCKNNVQLYHEACLQKKQQHTFATIDQLFVPQY